MDSRIKLLVVGAGPHGSGFHMPALARYRSQNPGRLGSVLVCDLDRGRAVSAARRYGFEKSASDVAEVLGDWRPDAAMVLTSVQATVEVSRRIIEAGIPVLLEKPPGETVAEAEELDALSAQASTPVMVSMNRRFDPVLRAAMARVKGRRCRYLRVTFAREHRTEDRFLTDTALHAVDAMRMLGGDIVPESLRWLGSGGASWRVATFKFVSGAMGCFEILPASGANAERYEITGEGFRGIAKTCFYDDGELCWKELNSEPELQIYRASRPVWELDGTLEETFEFLDSHIEGRIPRPTPADVMQSVRIVHRLNETPERLG